MFSTGWGEKSRKWSIANKSGLSAKILGVDGRVLLSHIELVCLVLFFFFIVVVAVHHCVISCQSPHHVLGCFLISINQSILSSFFLKPLLVYDLSITVVLLFKFFFFHVLFREHGFPCVFLNALLKHFVNCSHTLCNSQWSKATWCSMGWLSRFFQ